MSQPVSILIVDDDDKLRHLLIDTLQSLGYNATGATNGEEALSLLTQEKIDLVITDVKMPYLDGIKLLKEVKKKNPQLPILMITGYSFAFPAEQALKAGADGFLAKPFRIGRIEELIQSALSKKKTTPSTSSAASRKILVVDDDPTLLEILLETLETLGYESAGAVNGQEALSKLKNRSFDLVITDIRMPHLDGLSLLRNVKEINPKIPVIMITGFSLAYPSQRALREGADGYLVKPFRIDKIEELVKNLLSEE